MLLIFDASQGYPARCIGRHPEEGDPVVITGLVGAVGADDAGFESEDARYLYLDGDPAGGGQVQVDTTRKALEAARTEISREVLLAHSVIEGVHNYILRQHISDLSQQEQEALDIVGNALPDVATLRALVGRLETTLQQANTVLETLAAS